jgi:hypothetical protein
MPVLQTGGSVGMEENAYLRQERTVRGGRGWKPGQGERKRGILKGNGEQQVCLTQAPGDIP